MGPDAIRAFLRSGVFIIVVAIALILAVPRDSAEFVISVCSLGIGLALTGLVILFNRFTQ